MLIKKYSSGIQHHCTNLNIGKTKFQIYNENLTQLFEDLVERFIAITDKRILLLISKMVENKHEYDNTFKYFYLHCSS